MHEHKDNVEDSSDEDSEITLNEDGLPAPSGEEILEKLSDPEEI